MCACIPIQPSAGLHWPLLQLHIDKHCFPYIGYGHTISQWGPIWPASHSVNACFMKPENIRNILIYTLFQDNLDPQGSNDVYLKIWKKSGSKMCLRGFCINCNRHWKIPDDNVEIVFEIFKETSSERKYVNISYYNSL